MTLLVMLQNAVANPPIVPRDSDGWLGWIIRNVLPIVGALGIAWRIAVRPINDRISKIDDPKTGLIVVGDNGLGDRITVVEKKADVCDVRTLELQRAVDGIIQQVGNMREEFGETRRAIKELTDAMRESNQTTHNLLANVRVDIARTDERVKAIGDIKDVIREVFSGNNNNNK